VIRLQAVLHITGLFLLLLAATMTVPLGYALLRPGPALRPLALGLGVTLGTGLALFRLFPRPQTELSLREAILLVSSAWSMVGIFGALPFYFSPWFASFTDAVFESISGFTTTGATILPAVEVLPAPLQFWRCFTHWIGGMGIVLLGIAVLPLLGGGGMHLYRAEFSGARSEKLKPRIAETVLSLWRIYVALTLAEFIALKIAGLNSFEALCHSFSTLGTGGFSTRTASIAGFESPAIEYIIIVFMILAGVNFTRHYQLWIQQQPGAFFRDVEIRAYLAVLAASILILASQLKAISGYQTEAAFRAAAFQATSIVTTTGFVTDDYEKWTPLCQLLLLLLMFIGGCTGSTAGGLKVARFVLLVKVVHRQFRRMVEPRAIFAIRLGGQVVPEETVESLLNMLYLALMVFASSSLLVAAMGADLVTAIAAVAACMFNVGPGLGAVGPADNYAHFPAVTKWILAFCMICGRLEFFTALVIFTRTFWRK